VCAILGCVAYVPMLWSKLNTINSELHMDMLEFKVHTPAHTHLCIHVPNAGTVQCRAH
jgi:hypothetical protein